jgi:hypothetical protein
VGLSVITSIISAKLTTTALSVTYIMGMRDVTGTLCIESNYQVLTDFVMRDPAKPVSLVFESIDVCIAMLQTGEVQAVVTGAWRALRCCGAATHAARRQTARCCSGTPTITRSQTLSSAPCCSPTPSPLWCAAWRRAGRPRRAQQAAELAALRPAVTAAARHTMPAAETRSQAYALRPATDARAARRSTPMPATGSWATWCARRRRGPAAPSAG